MKTLDLVIRWEAPRIHRNKWSTDRFHCDSCLSEWSGRNNLHATANFETANDPISELTLQRVFQNSRFQKRTQDCATSRADLPFVEIQTDPLTWHESHSQNIDCHGNQFSKFRFHLSTIETDIWLHFWMGWLEDCAAICAAVGNTVLRDVPYQCPHCKQWSAVNEYGGNIIQGATCPKCGKRL
jgi:hypothetical protein